MKMTMGEKSKLKDLSKDLFQDVIDELYKGDSFTLDIKGLYGSVYTGTSEKFREYSDREKNERSIRGCIYELLLDAADKKVDIDNLMEEYGEIEYVFDIYNNGKLVTTKKVLYNRTEDND